MDVIFEDDAILVVNKPAGQYVHPSPGHETGVLTDDFTRRCPAARAVGSVERPGVVHRLDADTSGVMVLAKTQEAYLALRRQFERHDTVEKTYLAVLHGAPRPAAGTITSPVGRARLRAVSHWTVLGRKNGLALVEFRIETGRMHQIRIHARELGAPIVGDPLYGAREKDARLRVKPARTLLHAVALAFRHPVTGRRVEFAAPPPADIVYAV